MPRPRAPPTGGARLCSSRPPSPPGPAAPRPQAGGRREVPRGQASPPRVPMPLPPRGGYCLSMAPCSAALSRGAACTCHAVSLNTNQQFPAHSRKLMKPKSCKERRDLRHGEPRGDPAPGTSYVPHCHARGCGATACPGDPSGWGDPCCPWGQGVQDGPPVPCQQQAPLGAQLRSVCATASHCPLPAELRNPTCVCVRARGLVGMAVHACVCVHVCTA